MYGPTCSAPRSTLPSSFSSTEKLDTLTPVTTLPSAVDSAVTRKVKPGPRSRLSGIGALVGTATLGLYVLKDPDTERC